MLFSEDLNLKNRTLSVNHFIKTINQVAYIGRDGKKLMPCTLTLLALHYLVAFQM
jgi:hypothetical protein